MTREFSTQHHAAPITKWLFLLTFCLSCISVSPVYAQQNDFIPKSKKEIERDNNADQKDRRRIISSNIFSVTKEVFQYKFGKPDKKGIPEYYRKFNRSGYKIEETSYNSVDGSVAAKSTFRYDSKGNLIEETAANGGTVAKTSHRYNSSNLLDETVMYNASGAIEKKIVYTYDDNRLLLEVSGFLGDGRQYMKDSYYYDGENNLTELKNKLTKIAYSYDEEGNVSLIQKFSRYFKATGDASFVLTDQYRLTHNADGFLTDISHFASDSTLKIRFQYILDDKGRIVKENEFGSDNKLNYQQIYLYDKNGNTVEESGTDRGRKFRTSHKYDSRGNIAESIIYDQINEPAQLVKYIYGKYGVTPEETAARASIKETTENGKINVLSSDEYISFIGSRIIAPDGVYLGLVSADTVHPESIMNIWGQYGMDTSPSSIFNASTSYGGPDGVFSPFNDLSPSPPSLFKDGKFVSYLTSNDNYRPRISPEKLIDFLDKIARAKK